MDGIWVKTAGRSHPCDAQNAPGSQEHCIVNNMEIKTFPPCCLQKRKIGVPYACLCQRRLQSTCLKRKMLSTNCTNDKILPSKNLENANTLQPPSDIKSDNILLVHSDNQTPKALWLDLKLLIFLVRPLADIFALEPTNPLFNHHT